MENFKRKLIKETLTLPENLEKMKQWLEEKKFSSLSAFASFLCKEFNFVDLRGLPQDSSCISALRYLERQGKIDFDEFRQYKKKGAETHSNTVSHIESAIPVPIGVPENVKDIKELKLVRVTNRPQLLLWNTIMLNEHYLGACLQPGIRICYLVTSEHGVLGGMSYGAAALHVKSRDEWIGWNNEERKNNLDRVINMSRFLIRSGFYCRNLASKVIGMSVKQVQQDCLEVYKFVPYIAETFVDSTRFDGTCYKAAGWQNLGLTVGRGWDDRYSTHHLPPKHMYVYPLLPDFRNKLGLKPVVKHIEWKEKGPLQITECLDPDSWVKFEFECCKFGSLEKNQTLIMGAQQIAKAYKYSIQYAFSKRPRERSRWHCLIESSDKELHFKSILDGHNVGTCRRMQLENNVLCFQDDFKCMLVYPASLYTKKGNLTKQVAVFNMYTDVHITLATTTQGIPLGLLKATMENPWLTKDTQEEKKPKEGESNHWLEHVKYINEVGQNMPKTKLITVCDYGGDIASFMHECVAKKHVDVIMRVKGQCLLTAEQSDLFECLQRKTIAGVITMNVPRRIHASTATTVSKRQVRKAQLQVSFGTCSFAPLPGKARKTPFKVNFISVVEIKPPKKSDKIEWQLLTTLAVRSLHDVERCLKFYMKKWSIAEFKMELNSVPVQDYFKYKQIQHRERFLAVNMVFAWRRMLLREIGEKTSQ